MNATDVETTPDAFTSDGECWARRKTAGVIGVTPHTHVCREPVDDEAHHDSAHHCGCGAEW